MKVLQVCHKYFPSIGGVEEHVKNISERLAINNTVAVFTCEPSVEVPHQELINGVLVRRFKSFSPSDAYHLSFKMLRELQTCEFDVVHGHNYHAFPLHLCRYARRGRFVITPHYHGHGHTLFRDMLLKLCKPLGKRVFAEADMIVAVSRYEKELLLQDFGIPEDRVTLIPNGVDLQEIRGVGQTARDSNTILCVGRLEKYKGIQNIIKVLPIVDDSFHLKIVGTGSYERELVKLVHKLNLESRVEFYRRLPRQELLNTYTKAGILMLLSEHEASSIVIAEALASGTPCIVAETSGLSEWVDNKNCFGIELPIALDKLARLVHDVAGREVQNVEFRDWDQVAAEIFSLYNQGRLVGDHRHH